MAIIHITKDNFSSEVLNAKEPILLDFWASWCGPCKMMGTVLDRMSSENPALRIGKINIDEQPELAAQFQVMAIPTFAVVKNGKVTDTAVGGQSPDKLLAMMK